MRAEGEAGRDSHTREGFLQGARGICSLAGLLWIAALIALFLVHQSVSYTVCGGTLLQLPPPPVHWPPQGHNLGLLSLLHQLTLASVGATVIGVFLVLYATPEIDPFRRAGWLVITIVGSLMLAALLWMVGEYYSVTEQIDALGRCL
jgi:hypothetical protein